MVTLETGCCKKRYVAVAGSSVEAASITEPRATAAGAAEVAD
jgi:hypothetical protein